MTPEHTIIAGGWLVIIVLHVCALYGQWRESKPQATVRRRKWRDRVSQVSQQTAAARSGFSSGEWRDGVEACDL